MRVVPVLLIFMAGCGPDAGAARADVTATTAVTNHAATTSFAAGKTEFSAGFFIEAYCSGCHQANYVAPNGHAVALFTNDPGWSEPFQNPNWFSALEYGWIVSWGEAIRCGVYPGSLPPECASVPDLPSGFFTKPEKFPPSGDLTSSSYGQTTPPPTCAYAADGHTCPQPSDYQRAKMVEWIESGYPL